MKPSLCPSFHCSKCKISHAGNCPPPPPTRPGVTPGSVWYLERKLDGVWTRFNDTLYTVLETGSTEFTFSVVLNFGAGGRCSFPPEAFTEQGWDFAGSNGWYRMAPRLHRFDVSTSP